MSDETPPKAPGTVVTVPDEDAIKKYLDEQAKKAVDAPPTINGTGLYARALNYLMEVKKDAEGTAYRLIEKLARRDEGLAQELCGLAKDWQEGARRISAADLQKVADGMARLGESWKEFAAKASFDASRGR